MSLRCFGTLAVVALLVAVPAKAQNHEDYLSEFLKGSLGSLEALSSSIDRWLQKEIATITEGDGAMPTVFYAVLTGDNQVPTPIATNTTGVIYMAVGKTSGAWALGVGVIEKFTMSHLHFGDAGANGAPVLILAPGGSAADGLPMYSPPISGGIAATGTFTANDITIPEKTTPTLQDLKDAILAGNVYANIHTTDAPAGLVRAQLEETTFEMP